MSCKPYKLHILKVIQSLPMAVVTFFVLAGFDPRPLQAVAPDFRKSQKARRIVLLMEKIMARSALMKPCRHVGMQFRKLQGRYLMESFIYPSIDPCIQLLYTYMETNQDLKTSALLTAPASVVIAAHLQHWIHGPPKVPAKWPTLTYLSWLERVRSRCVQHCKAKQLVPTKKIRQFAARNS